METSVQEDEREEVHDADRDEGEDQFEGDTEVGAEEGQKEDEGCRAEDVHVDGRSVMANLLG